MIPIELIVSVVAAVGSLLAGLLTQLLASRRRQDRAGTKEEIERLAEVLQSEEAARKAAALQLVIERIPVGLPPDQFSQLVEEIASRLVAVVREVPETRSAVENLINNYHEQALGQAKAQFWFSVVAATIGFAWILYSGANISADNFASVSKILPGVVMDAVAFLFFKQASETRQRATELYDRLRRDKQMAESVPLVSSIEDIKVRSAVKAQIALHMSGLEPKPIDLGSFLSSDWEGTGGHQVSSTTAT